MDDKSTASIAYRGRTKSNQHLYDKTIAALKSANDHVKIKKYPPFGKKLADRKIYINMPLLVVCYEKDAWEDQKTLAHNSDNESMVLSENESPDLFTWPVLGCHVVIDWSFGLGSDKVVELVNCLISSSAKTVTVCPAFANPMKSSLKYRVDNLEGERWVQIRELVNVFHGGNVNVHS